MSRKIGEKMKKEIEIWDKKLEISKTETGYMINKSNLDLFIHADKLSYKEKWLNLFKDDSYIGSLWINSDTDMKKIKEFLEETK